MESDAAKSFDPYHKWLGVPPAEQPPDHYRLLGIQTFEDDGDVIASAADRQMAHLKSFAAGPFSSHSQKLLDHVARARVCLLNAQSKRKYDEQLRAASATPTTHGDAQESSSGPLRADSPPSQKTASEATSTDVATAFELPKIEVTAGRASTGRNYRRNVRSRNIPAIFSAGVLVLMGLAVAYVVMVKVSPKSDFLNIFRVSESREVARPELAQPNGGKSEDSPDGDAQIHGLRKPKDASLRARPNRNPEVGARVKDDAVPIDDDVAIERDFAIDEVPAKEPPLPTELAVVLPDIADASSLGTDQSPVKSNIVQPAVVQDDVIPEILSYRDLEDLCSKQRTAESALGLYNAFLENPDVPVDEKDLATTTHVLWTDRAEAGMVRVGKQWLLPEAATSIRRQELESIAEALRLINLGQRDHASSRLRRASRINPDSIWSEFLRGLLNAVVARRPEDALTNFHLCVRRHSDNLEVLTEAERANLIAALNNLAITEVRQRRYVKAIRHWETAFQMEAASPELIHNLGRFIRLAKAGRMPTARHSVKAAEDLLSQIVEGTDIPLPDQGTGWLFVGYRPDLTDLDSELKDASARAAELTLQISDLSGALNTKYGAGNYVYTYEDRWCLTCNGHEEVRCTARRCANGRIPDYKVESYEDPVSGAVTSRKSRIRVPCPTCNGNGTVPCSDCNKGIDKALLR